MLASRGRSRGSHPLLGELAALLGADDRGQAEAVLAEAIGDKLHVARAASGRLIRGDSS